MGKRGLSDIIVTVLIILLAIAATVLIWGFIKNNLQNAGSQIETSLSKTTLSIPEKSVVTNRSTTTLSFVVKKDTGSETLSGILVVLKDKNQKTASIRYNSSLKELETMSVSQINYSSYGLSDIIEITVAPLMISSSGKDFVGANNVYIIPASNETCPNDVIDPGEDCDRTLLNSKQCKDVLGVWYSGSLSCDYSCKFNTSNCIFTIPSDNSLVLYWSFNNDTTKATDYSGKNNGTFSNGAYTSASCGKYGNGTCFDGVDDSLNITMNQNINSSGAISFWANSKNWNTSWPNSNYLFNFGSNCDGALLLRQQLNLLEIVFKNSTSYQIIIDPSSPPPINEWHHYLITWDNKSSIIKYYLDSKSMINYTWTNGFSTIFNMGALGVGFCKNTNRYFNGSIDELVVLNRSLNYSEVLDLYNLRLIVP